MAYMSKTKKRRVRKQQLIRGLIAIVVIAAVFIIVWQASLGSNVVNVNGAMIRSGMVKGVESFVTYYQTGQFPGDDMKGLTGDEKQTAEDMALVATNSMVQSIFVTNEVILQHFKAEGKVFPDEETAAGIQETVDALFANIELSRLFRNHGVTKSHAKFYYTYQAAISLFMDEVLAKNPATDEEIQEQYEIYKPFFTTPETVTASHILIMDADHTAAKRAEIQAILDRLNEGEDFATLAMEYSDDSSSEFGGELGEFQRGVMVEPFEEAAFALEPGEISGIVETEFGFHIIKVTAKTEAGYQPLEDVKDQLIEVINNERLTEAINALKEEAVIQYYGLINPTTGKPPISLPELYEARGIDMTEDTTDIEDEHDHDNDHDHDHDH